MSNASRIYIGQLTNEIREYDVEDFFKGYGKIRDINLKQGYGFVEFEDYRDASDAVHDLNGKHLMGERIRVEMARGRGRGFMDRRGMGGGGFRGRGRGRGMYNYRPPPSDFDSYTDYEEKRRCSVVVRDLPKYFTYRKLKDFARQAGGEIITTNYHRERKEAIVEYRSPSEADDAVKSLDGKKLNGERVSVRAAKISDVTDRRSRSRSVSSEDDREKSEPRKQSPSDDGE